MNGYLLTETAQEALECFELEGVRFVASLDDGSGFVAFDGVSPAGAGFTGRIFIAQEPHPDDPRTWPDWSRIIPPKRRIATGLEHFALISEALAEYAMGTEAVKGIAYVGNGLLLIESDGPVVGGDVWNGGVVSYRDKRVLASV